MKVKELEPGPSLSGASSFTLDMVVNALLKHSFLSIKHLYSII